MGIYINMEMPKGATVFVIDSAGQVWSNEWPTRGYIRLDGVTAVPVPPHGRLGDLDALAEEHRIRAYECYNGSSYQFHITAKAWVDDAPTIIPAEEEKS